jgi:hypothetical protein
MVLDSAKRSKLYIIYFWTVYLHVDLPVIVAGAAVDQYLASWVNSGMGTDPLYPSLYPDTRCQKNRGISSQLIINYVTSLFG